MTEGTNGHDATCTVADPIGIDLSVVIPVYGSAPIISKLVATLEACLDTFSPGRYEVILVHDAGPDNAWELIEAHARTRPWLKGVDLAKNAGQHNAVMTGLRLARGTHVVTMDDDLQHDPADIPRIIEKLESGHDLCYVAFQSRKHAAWKRLGSWFNGNVAQFLIGKPKGLYLSPFRGIRRHVVDTATRYEGPFVYVDGLLLQSTNSITTITATHHPRDTGASGYSLRKSISLWLKMATSFSATPLRLVSVAGGIGAMLSFLLALVVAAVRIREPDMPVGWASLIVSIFLMGSLQLIALGIIGEYIARVLLTLNRKPQSVIRSTTNLP